MQEEGLAGLVAEPGDIDIAGREGLAERGGLAQRHAQRGRALGVGQRLAPLPTGRLVPWAPRGHVLLKTKSASLAAS